MIEVTKTRDLVLVALFVAIVYIATWIISLPVMPGGGLVHTGTAALFVISVCFGPKKGAIAGSVGMALFNLTSIWVAWAPYTFVIRLVMGLIIGYVAHWRGAQGKKPVQNVIALAAGGLWFLPTSYVAQIMIMRVPWEVPMAAIPGNVMQLVIALALGMPMIGVINRYKLNR